ncbi:cilia- and flagella-associated protein 298-like [Artemia franciscana]|uniref:cilia- and flagella-associated protein 298-like n=1 Tax=Artemia franciscana TaxID=6661 RepID=UPI0032D9E7A7
MVILTIKIDDIPQMLYETPSSTMIQIVFEKIVNILNGIAACTKALKCAENILNNREGKEPQKEALKQVFLEVEALVSLENVSGGKPMNEDTITEALVLLRDTLKLFIDDQEALREIEIVSQLLKDEKYPGAYNTKDYSLWFSSRELELSKKISDYVGKNEKTKATFRLNPNKDGIPTRGVKEDETQFLLHTFRRQEELARLETSDSRSNPQWGDPQSLRRAMQGISDITWHS